jgi:hypothetical protein
MYGNTQEQDEVTHLKQKRDCEDTHQFERHYKLYIGAAT